MLTFKLDMDQLDMETATEVADLANSFHNLNELNRRKTPFIVSENETFGLVVEIEEFEGCTLFGETSLVGSTPIQNSGIVDSMLPAARWFLFLATAYGVCTLQDDHETVIDVMGLSLDALIALYKPTEDWQRQGIEQQLRYFRNYNYQPTSERGIALTFF